MTGGGTYNFSYGYNLAGALTSETYPSGRVITTGYDNANRPNLVTGKLNGGAQTNYVANVSYFPHGAPQGFQYGNNVWRGDSYNNRLQASCLWDTINLSTSAYLFTQCPISWGTNNNNGNLQSVTTQAGGPGTQSSLPVFTGNFTYDALNRLASASDMTGSTTNWSRTFQYDQFGNAWVPSASGVGYGPTTPNGDVYGSTTNQIPTSPYDAAGNITALLPGYGFTYDAENRVTTETNTGGLSANYYYDGAGDRVEKVLLGGASTVYVYDAFGQLAEEYSPATTWAKDYIPFNGQTAAVENATADPCTTCYLSYDYLGTPRMVTDANANVMGRHDYLPFGDEIPGGIAGRSSQFGPYVDNVEEKFTGQVRDNETLNDFFNARYYAAPLMRFLSPDPGNAGADPTDPQTWNAYTYVRNNPLNAIDPSGMDPIAPDPGDPWDLSRSSAVRRGASGRVACASSKVVCLALK